MVSCWCQHHSQMLCNTCYAHTIQVYTLKAGLVYKSTGCSPLVATPPHVAR